MKKITRVPDWPFYRVVDSGYVLVDPLDRVRTCIMSTKSEVVHFAIQDRVIATLVFDKEDKYKLRRKSGWERMRREGYKICRVAQVIWKE